jgi:hypothetical protein
MVLLMNGVHQSKLKTLDLASLEIAQPHDMTEKKDEKKMTLVIWLVAPMYVFDEYKR